MKKILFFGLFFVFCLMMNVYAADQGSDMGQPSPPEGMSERGAHPMRLIPQEAITACKGKAEGASCVAGRGGKGTCSYTPDKKYFACKPNDKCPGGNNPDGK